jgi:D-alanyl-D-alanine carboxypeptidase
VAAHGEAHTRRYVAMPGYSEHQTGLALDLTLYDARGDMVEDDDVEAYARLIPHYHEFGFIVRYPEGKEDVTGYRFEPWHIRYVGDEAAREIHGSGLTLEEYVSRK